MEKISPGIIEIQVDKVAQLFATLDPFPFRERDLDREAEEYIVDWARELPKSAPIRLLIHLPAAEAESEHGRDLANAMKTYFRYRAEITNGDLKELFRVGRYALLVGLLVLALAILSGRLLLRTIPSGMGTFLNEGLIILGWVANWRPIEIFLYDWWPLVRRRALYRRLAAADVVLYPRQGERDMEGEREMEHAAPARHARPGSKQLKRARSA